MPEQLTGGSFGLQLGSRAHPVQSFYVMMAVMVVALAESRARQPQDDGKALRATRDDADAAKLKEAALKLNNKIVTITGPYEINETGKQFKNEFAVMQNTPGGVEVVYPAEIATAKAIYPVPPYKDRK